MVLSNPCSATGSLFSKLVELIRTLRSENGCPWDKKQKLKSFHHYVLEEYHELVTAINEDNQPEIVEETGDLIFQVLFLGCMIEDEGYGSLADALLGVHEKMIRRHPHVFGDLSLDTDAEVLENWVKIKQSEEKVQARKSMLDGIPRSLPALSRAQQLASRAARVGFDWNTLTDMAPKIEEELLEFRDAVENNDIDKIRDEFGDILFMLVNVGRRAGIDSEAALNEASDKFYKRFRYIETILQTENRSWNQADLYYLNKLWDESKKLVN